MKTQIAIITPIPEMVLSVQKHTMLQKAVDRKKIEFHIVNLRDYGEGNYRQIDDAPFGGGAGMVMMARPLFKAIEEAIHLVGGDDGLRIIYPSPQGEPWDQNYAKENCALGKFIFICGHYKGIDERVIKRYVTHEFSLGDFVVTSGEMPGLIMIDSFVRLIPGVLNKIESAMTDTFSGDLLDAPYYTQPRKIEGMAVPEVLLTGHHKNIQNWKFKRQKEVTKKKRPDIWHNYLKLSKSEHSHE